MNANAEFQTINELDLTSISAKMTDQESGEGWSLEKASAVELEYRRFLCLMKLFPDEQVAPLVDVDIYWHNHILDTMKYAADCERIFGYFLHHLPSGAVHGEDDEVARQLSGARMQQLYEDTFGQSYIRQEASAMAPLGAQPAAAATAWCVPTHRHPARLRAAKEKPAWCVPTHRNAVQTPAKTAWCVPTHGNPEQASAKTAWCVPTHRNAAQATATTAWCVPTHRNDAQATAKTAWCVPTHVNPAWLQGAIAITERSHGAAQNNRAYSHTACAEAA